MQRCPCLVLDKSKNGFRVAGAGRLRRGQAVELSLGEHSPESVQCSVRWIAKDGEAGLRME